MRRGLLGLAVPASLVLASCGASWSYVDGDGDGYTVADGDCLDSIGTDGTDPATVFPGAEDTPYDGVDSDCGGEDDYDQDGDGYVGDDHVGLATVGVPGSGSLPGGDCWDVPQGPAGVVDDNEQGLGGVDIHPGAVEYCNGFDDDCDGGADDEDPEGPAFGDYYNADADGDGYGDGGTTVLACSVPDGHVSDDQDCDDTDAQIHPGADERCNDLDDDCDGDVDDADADTPVDPSTWYADLDGDGYGGSEETAESCDAPADHTATPDDCDDTDAAVFPGADEICNGIDDDCDGGVDDDDPEGPVDGAVAYEDGDGDGFGTGTGTGTGDATCALPDGTADNGDDCDDSDAAVNPDATEVCNGIDDDCDGAADDDDPEGPDDPSTWYADADGDGYGTADDVYVLCTQPSDTVADGTDCDDTDDQVYPGAAEWCDSLDNDCDGDIDDDDADGVADGTAWYPDADGDGYGDSSSAATEACEAPSGYVDDDEDCDDTSDIAADVYPGATEICGDGAINDCDATSADCGLDGSLGLSDADAIFVGETASDGTGIAVAGAGDQDGDGTDDLVIGSWYRSYDGTSGGGSSHGGGYLVFGASSGSVSLGTSSALVIDGGESLSLMGRAVASGDVSGDGTSDLLFGANGADADSGDSGSGQAFLYLGPLSSVGEVDGADADVIILGAADDDSLGRGVAVLGNFDGDGGGLGDLAIGAHESDLSYDYTTANTSGSGTVYILFGAASWSGTVDLATDADAALYGQNKDDNTARTVAAVGDVDGDGLDDLVAGSPGNDANGTNSGAAYLVLGDALSGDGPIYDGGNKFGGAAKDDLAGTSVSGGDSDGDGYSDVLIGAPGADSAKGEVYLSLGGTGAASGNVHLVSGTVDVVLTGATAGDKSGVSVGLASDLDADGFDDVVVGGFGENSLNNCDSDSDPGTVYVVYGPVTTDVDLASADVEIASGTAGDCLGVVGSTPLDHDGDGVHDLLLGAPGYDGASGDEGAAVLFYGGGP